MEVLRHLANINIPLYETFLIDPFTILHNSTEFTFCTLSADFNYHIHVLHHLTHQMFEQKI